MRTVKAYLNHGAWKVDCPIHGKSGAVLAQFPDENHQTSFHTQNNEYICPVCHPGIIAMYDELQGKRLVHVPDSAVRLEARKQAKEANEIYRVVYPRNREEIELAALGRLPMFAHWQPGQTVDDMLGLPTHNSYVTPITFVALQTLTAAQMNGINANITELGQIFGSAGNLPYASSTSTLGVVAIGAGGYILISNGSQPAWVPLSTITSGSGQALVSGQAAGDIFYASTAANLARRAIGSAGQTLISNGTAPAWVQLATLVSGSGQPFVASQAAGDWFYAIDGGNVGRVAGAPYGIPRNDSGGTAAVLFTQNEMCRAIRSTDLTTGPGTVLADTAISMNGEDIDDGGWHATGTLTSRIVPVSSGRYKCDGQMAFANASGVQIDSVTLNIECSDGDVLGSVMILGVVNGATVYLNVSGKTKDLTAGQYITLSTSRSNATSGITIKATDTWIQVERVR